MIIDKELYAHLSELSIELEHELHHGRYDTITNKAYKLAHNIGDFADYLDRATFLGIIENKEIEND